MASMEDVKEEQDWFSTYGLLTAKRILSHFNIYLNNEELITAIKNPANIYFQLLQIPLKNIFNGIILQQAHDYQVYLQKLFVDYFMAGEASKDNESPGAQIRDDIRDVHETLINFNGKMQVLELEQKKFIATSQRQLIGWANLIKKKGTQDNDLQHELQQSGMLDQASTLNVQIRNLRQELHGLIIKAVELMNLLPDYGRY